MSASGKSSNRLSEWYRGYFTGSGHGPYALQGIEDRRRHDELVARQSIMEYQEQVQEQDQDGRAWPWDDSEEIR
jgi:hypothetical protein